MILMKKIGGVIAFIPWGIIGRFASSDGQLAWAGLGVQLVGVVILGIAHIIDPDSMPIRWSWGRS